MRILWNAKDAPWIASGYGVVSKHLLPRFARQYGADNIHIMAPVYVRDFTTEWEGMQVLPGINWDYSEEMVKSHWDNVKPTFYLQVGDWYQMKQVPQLAAANQILWVQWTPYDFLRVPKGMVDNTLRYAWKVVPWSRYAEEKLRAHGLTNVTPPIPLGVETQLWRPLDRLQLPLVMASLGFKESAYNILIIGANQRRKYWFEQLEGVGMYVRAHPEVEVRLYFHTHMQSGGEADMQLILEECGLGKCYVAPDAYTLACGGYSEEQLVMMVNCADVVLNAALEGFGLVQAQAQACGVPVITLSAGVGQEIVLYGVEVGTMGTDYAAPLLKPVPSPLNVADALAALHPLRGQRSSQAVEHIRKNYSWDVVAEQWFALIEQLMWERERDSLYVPTEPGPLLLEKAARAVCLP